MRKTLALAVYIVAVIFFGMMNHVSAHAADGEGTGTLSPDLVRIGTYVTITVEITVGQSGIAAGGGINVYLPNQDKRGGIPPYKNWSTPQTDTPSHAGYTTVSTSNPNVELLTVIEEETEPGFKGPLYCIHIGVVSGHLTSGDSVVVAYGDKSSGGPGAQVQPIPQDTDFSIFTDADGDVQYVEIAKSPQIKIVGGPPASIRVMIPSLLSPKESFDLKVVIVDRLGFKASGNTNLTISFSSSDPQALLPNDYRFTDADDSSHVFHNVSFASFKVQTITVTDIISGTSFKSNPCYVLSNSFPTRIYWGDMHWHSKLSDGLRTPDEGYLCARDEFGLDFSAMTDHENMHPSLDDTWWYAQLLADAYYDPYSFVTFTAYEWTSPGQSIGGYGHRCVYYLDNGPLFPHFKSLNPKVLAAPEELWANLAGRQAITIPHHPAVGAKETDWSHYNDTMQPLVEIASIWGVSEYYDPNYPDLAYNFVDGHSVRDAWAMGHKMGVIASSDDHNTFPGHKGFLTAVYSSELTRAGIAKNLVNRRTYATTGGRIILYFKADGHLMGDQYYTSSAPQFVILAVGTKPVEAVELIKYDQNSGYRTIASRGPLLRPPNKVYFTHEDTDFVEDSFYYVREIQEGESKTESSRAWSSPIWVNVAQ